MSAQTWGEVADVAGMVLIFLGSLLSLAAAIGLLRFPDLLTRMHAGTKPQVLGVLLVLLGVALRLRTGLDMGMLVLVGAFQMMTLPVAAHMVGKAAYRTGQSTICDLAVDELSGTGPLAGQTDSPADPRPPSR